MSSSTFAELSSNQLQLAAAKMQINEHQFIAPPPGLSLEGETESGSESDGKAEDNSSTDDPDTYQLVTPPRELSSDSDSENSLKKEQRTEEETTETGSESNFSTRAHDKASNSSDDPQTDQCIGPPPGLSLEEQTTDSVVDTKVDEVVPADEKFRAKSEAHLKGECRPCAYFWGQADGCRRGDECSFCHLCDKDALKKWKKAKKLRLKAEAAEERARLEEEEAESFNESVPATVSFPLQHTAAPFQPMPMFWPMEPTMPAFAPTPVMPPMPPKRAKFPAEHTPLSAQSKPYVPASAFANHMGMHGHQHQPEEAVNEVNQLVEQYVETGEKLLASLELAREQMTQQVMRARAELDACRSGGQQATPDVKGELLKQLDRMAKELDAADTWGTSHAACAPYW